MKAIILSCLLLLVGCDKQHDLVVKDVEGQKIHFSALKGKWIVINYWATWCSSCFEEIPTLNALAKKRSQDVVVLGVNFEGEKAELKSLIQKMGIKFNVLSENPAKALGIPQISSIPLTIIIDPNGRVAEKLNGTQTLEAIESRLTS